MNFDPLREYWEGQVRYHSILAINAITTAISLKFPISNEHRLKLMWALMWKREASRMAIENNMTNLDIYDQMTKLFETKSKFIDEVFYKS